MDDDLPSIWSMITRGLTTLALWRDQTMALWSARPVHSGACRAATASPVQRPGATRRHGREPKRASVLARACAASTSR